MLEYLGFFEKFSAVPIQNFLKNFRIFRIFWKIFRYIRKFFKNFPIYSKFSENIPSYTFVILSTSSAAVRTVPGYAFVWQVGRCPICPHGLYAPCWWHVPISWPFRIVLPSSFVQYPYSNFLIFLKNRFRGSRRPEPVTPISRLFFSRTPGAYLKTKIGPMLMARYTGCPSKY